MLNKSRVHLLAVFLISLLLVVLAFGTIVVQAQNNDPTPAATEPAPADSTPAAAEPAEATAAPTAPVAPTPAPDLPEIDLGAAADSVNFSLQRLVELAVSIVVVVLAAVYGARLIIWLLRKITRRTKTDVDQILLEAVKPQIGWLIAAIGFQIITSRLDFIEGAAKTILENTYFILYLLVVVATAWRVGDAALDWYVAQRGDELNKNLVQQVFPLLKRLTHIFLAIIFVVILAGHFGVNVLAISAALGLGGFAIALAAQDTISNIISGLVIMFDSPFKIGDRIEVTGLDTWGDVVNIGIRSTQVQTRDNRLVIVPNTAVVDSAVVNYSRPDNTYRLQSDIGIGSGMDISKVQGLIRETVRQLDGILPDKPVDVWFTEFGDSSNTMRVRWWVASYAEKRRSTDSVNAAIQELANREGIDMPNPIYTLENQIRLSDEDVQRIAKALIRVK
jgi:small-conductance mechanosensitive channel